MKNHIYIILILSIFSCKGQKNNDHFLLPYQVGNKWGLADTLGNIKVAPQYDSVLNFFIDPYNRPQSYYYVKKGNTIHFIDQNNDEYFKDFDIVKTRDNELRFAKNKKIGIIGPEFKDGKWFMDGDPSSAIYDDMYDFPENSHHFTMLEIDHKKVCRHMTVS